MYVLIIHVEFFIGIKHTQMPFAKGKEKKR